MNARKMKHPRDYEVMDTVLDRGDAGELARRLSCSPQLVRAWCRAPEQESEYSTGRNSPLGRVAEVIGMVREEDGDSSRAYPIGVYIAGLLGGSFVPHPPVVSPADSEALQKISTALKESCEAIEAARTYWFDEDSPGRFTLREQQLCVEEIDQAIVALIQLRRWVEGV